MNIFDEFPGFCIGCIVVILIVGLGYLTYKEGKQWEQFSIEHNCKITGKMSGSTHVGTTVVNGRVGTTTSFEAGKTGYTCDDGITYWR